jgi:hypothetical protein
MKHVFSSLALLGSALSATAQTTQLQLYLYRDDADERPSFTQMYCPKIVVNALQSPTAWGDASAIAAAQIPLA